MSQDDTLQSSPLAKLHQQAEATMGEEGGWAMPVSFGGPLDEVQAVHERGGVTDRSHLGRIRVRGDGALPLLEAVCTADVARQEDDTVIPTALCNDKGGLIDVCRLIRLERFWVLMTSPGNGPKVLEHLKQQNEYGAKIDDQSRKVAQLGLIGPAVKEILSKVLPFSIDELEPGKAKMGSMMIANYIACCTDCWGQWMLDIMVPNMLVGKAWTYITGKAGDNALPPIGLAACDILRVEGGACRYGHELNELIDPITAGLSGVVDSTRSDYLGAAALAAVRPARRRVRLTCEKSLDSFTPDQSPEIPTLGTAILDAEGNEIGTVTSGQYSPTRQAVLAMGYVATGHADQQAVTVGPWTMQITPA